MSKILFRDLIILIFCLSSSLAFAEGCPRINLARKHKWVPKYKEIQTFDQEKSGTCYAFSTTTMFDYWRYQNEPRLFTPAKSSPIYAAYLSRRYNIEVLKKQTPKQKRTFRGGFANNVIKGIQTYGMCREDVIQKSLENFTKIKKPNSDKFLIATQTIFETYHNKKMAAIERLSPRRSWNKTYQDKFLKKFKRGSRKTFNSLVCQGKSPFYKDCSKLDKVYLSLMNHLEKGEDYYGFIHNIFKDCDKKENTYLSSYRIPSFTKSKIDWNWKKSMKILSRLLEVPNALPVMISYCGRLLEDNKLEGVSNRFGRLKTAKNCGRHASVILGQRKRKGRCQYLVRDSHGTDCKRYNRKWSCSGGSYNEGFGIWLDGEALAKNMYRLMYLKNI